jgi:hypothetical protein
MFPTSICLSSCGSGGLVGIVTVLPAGRSGPRLPVGGGGRNFPPGQTGPGPTQPPVQWVKKLQGLPLLYAPLILHCIFTLTLPANISFLIYALSFSSVFFRLAARYYANPPTFFNLRPVIFVRFFRLAARYYANPPTFFNVRPVIFVRFFPTGCSLLR